MNTKLFQEWMAALESGEFKQGRGALKQLDDDGEWRHCCLGVLCEIAGVTWLLQDGNERWTYVENGVDNQVSSQYPPVRLVHEVLDHAVIDPGVTITREIAERRTRSGSRFEEGAIYGVTTLNDEGIPFNLIADALRRTYWGEEK